MNKRLFVSELNLLMTENKKTLAGLPRLVRTRGLSAFGVDSNPTYARQAPLSRYGDFRNALPTPLLRYFS